MDEEERAVVGELNEKRATSANTSKARDDCTGDARMPTTLWDDGRQPRIRPGIDEEGERHYLHSFQASFPVRIPNSDIAAIRCWCVLGWDRNVWQP